MKDNTLIIIAAVLTALILGAMLFIKSHPVKPGKVTRDTVTVERIDTIYGDILTVHDTVPVAKFREVVRHDTVENEGEKIEIPIETAVYEDTLTDSVSYKAQISGYRASLDSIWINYPQKTIERTVEKEITITKTKTKHWGWGVHAGAGYGVITRKPDVFVGFTWGYTF